MKTKMISTLLMIFLSIPLIGSVQAMDENMKTMDQASMETRAGQFGELIHESNVDGYKLSYYFMDLRDQKTGVSHGEKAMKKAGNMKNMEMGARETTHDMKTMEMDKPHHLMVFINKGHDPVVKGKVGFLIANTEGTKQKEMGMMMSDGFGVTADMKEKGVYTIKTKAVVDGKKLMDSFDYEMK